MTIRILVADDESLLLSALSQILDLQDGFTVVGRATNGREAVDLGQELRPDIAVLDLEMPVMDGIAAAGHLSEAGIRVVIVTRHSRPAVLKRAFQMGASGFISKSTSSDKLAAILRDVHAGVRYVDPEIAALAMTAMPCPLTERELDMLRLLQQGKSAQMIAAETCLAIGTVRNYISNAILRLGVKNGREAAQRAWTEGWI